MYGQYGTAPGRPMMGQQSQQYMTQQVGNVPWSPRSPSEQQYFDSLFQMADVQGQGFIGGANAVAFFSKSGLDKSVLREVWSLSDIQRNSCLNRSGFYIAMRLIAMAQLGEPISLERLREKGRDSIPLPRFQGVPVPTVPVSSPFSMNSTEKTKYEAIFVQTDTDKDGFVLGKEAVELFQKSGLDRSVLRNIWTLSDRNHDNKLDRNEFCIAMHLIVCSSKRGMSVPSVLPEELINSVMPAPPQSVQRTSSISSLDGISMQRSSFSSMDGSNSIPQQRTSVSSLDGSLPDNSKRDRMDSFADLIPAQKDPEVRPLGGSSRTNSGSLASTVPSAVGSLNPLASTQMKRPVQMPKVEDSKEFKEMQKKLEEVTKEAAVNQAAVATMEKQLQSEMDDFGVKLTLGNQVAALIVEKLKTEINSSDLLLNQMIQEEQETMQGLMNEISTLESKLKASSSTDLENSIKDVALLGQSSEDPFADFEDASFGNFEST